LEIGFKQVTVDPEGFRSGRLNEAVTSAIEGK
jgi:PP-loop superfamily ATP-utilizing enzyme